jgi:DNA mismatch repair protein MutS
MALVKDYLEKTILHQNEYGNKCIVLMQVGAFFEVYGIQNKKTKEISGSSISDFGRICELNIVEKKVSIGKDDVVMAGFKDIMIDKYLKKLQNEGFTICVYVQDEQNKNTSRSLQAIISPGTFFGSGIENDINGGCNNDGNIMKNITNNVTCIWIDVIEKSLLLSKSKSNINLKQYIYIGISNIDIYTGRTCIFEYNDIYTKGHTIYDELERFISIYNPVETIIIANLSSKEINDMIHYTNIQSKATHIISKKSDEFMETMKEEEINTSEIKEKKESKINDSKYKRIVNCEKQNYQTEIIKKFYSESIQKKNLDLQFFLTEFSEYTFGTNSFCYLLDFIYQHNPNLVNKISEPVFENISDRLILANHSLKQLNIIDDIFTGKYSSVLKLLNGCITPMGKRSFTNILLNPTRNIDYLNKNYDMIEHIINQYIISDNIPHILSRESASDPKTFPRNIDRIKQLLLEMKDIDKLKRLFILKKMSPKNVYHYYYTIKNILQIYDIISKDSSIIDFFKYNHKEIENISNYCNSIISFLNTRINFDLCLDNDSIANFDVNFVRKEVNPELDIMTNTLNDSFAKLQSIIKYFNYLFSLKEKKDVEFIKLYETEKNNFSLITTKKRSKVLIELLTDVFNSNSNKKSTKDSSVQLTYVNSSMEELSFSFTIDPSCIESINQSASNNSISSKQIDELCKMITKNKNNMKDVIYTTFQSIIQNMTEMKMDPVHEFVTFVDVIFNKAIISNKYNYCKPTIVEKEKDCHSFIDAKNIRHCLIENIQQSEHYVPNDICLGVDYDSRGMLLYGTNAVGKTSFIKSIGISIIMAQAGLYVPASSFKYYPYQYIFTRIIGNDNIFKGLSTFAVEMSELRTILKLSNNKSLVLGDELCSGTESISAASIFVSGIHTLYNNQSTFIFATHLHEILKYSEIKEMKYLSLNHMSVFYNAESDTLVYTRKLEEGPGNNMYGLEVCKSLNLPTQFLEYANEIRMKYHPESASILSLKTSHYNSKKIMGVCELCKSNMGTEVHHLTHQKTADSKGMIINMDGVFFHKNKLANLMTLCESCHKAQHFT